jgi:hypothetical protein
VKSGGCKSEGEERENYGEGRGVMKREWKGAEEIRGVNMVGWEVYSGRCDKGEG